MSLSITLITMSQKSSIRTTSFWMALFAIFVSLIGTGISVIEAGILRDQQELMIEEKAAAVWPFVAGQTQVSESKAGIEIVFTLTNKGVGPAIINGITFSAGEVSGSIRKAIKNIELPGADFTIVPTLSKEDSEDVLAAGETIEVYKLLLVEKSPTPKPVEAGYTDWQLNRMQKASLLLTQLDYNYCYCSIYGDCWDSENQALKANEVCSGREMLEKAE